MLDFFFFFFFFFFLTSTPTATYSYSVLLLLLLSALHRHYQRFSAFSDYDLTPVSFHPPASLVQASPSPDLQERQTMTTLLASQTPVFDENKRTFGIKSRVDLMEKMERMEAQLAEIHAQREEDKRSLDHHRLLLDDHRLRLDQLEPARLQIASIRKPVLTKLAHSISENWPSDPLAVQSRNVFAHGGHLKTDIATIQSEPDPAEKQLLMRGFEMGYGVPLSLQKEFLKYNAIVKLMNLHCNLKTLDNMVGKTRDRTDTRKLLEEWKAWVGEGSNLETYPLTTDKESILLYNRLIRNHGNTIPKE